MGGARPAERVGFHRTMSRPLPSPCLVVLVGAPASGKSTWAAENFAADEIVESDALRAVAGEHRLDLAATDDAFELLDRIIEMRSGRRLTTVVDTTGLDKQRRAGYLAVAREHDLAAVAVHFTTTAAECRRRNRARDHPVSARALDTMLKAARAVDLSAEDWDVVLEPEPVRTVTPRLAAAADAGPKEAAAVANPSAAGLRFGLLLSRYDVEGGSEAIGPTLARLAGDAEQAGFDSLWVMDHMIQIPQVGSAWDPMLDSYTTLGFLAKATTTIRLGVLVSAVTFRNIGHLAKMIATLDVLSNGRAIAGVGAANFEREHVAYGWGFPSAPDRLARLADALEALPLFWGPGSPSFDGRTISIPEALCYPRPIQDPLPIIVGGSGERVTLKLVAKYASGCNLFGDLETVRERIATLHHHCADVGRDTSEVEVTHLGELLVGADRKDLRDRVDRLRPSNQGPAKFSTAANAGTIDDHEANFIALAAAGVDTAIVSTRDLTNDSCFSLLADLIGRFQP